MSEGKIETIQLMGWTLAKVDGAPEVRIHDLELGRRAGLSRPRDIRKTIARLEKRGRLPGVLRRDTVALRKLRNGGYTNERSTEYWLTRTEALKVINALETPPAEAMQDEMIRVFEMALDGKLPGQAAPLDLAAIRAMFQEEIASALEPVNNRLQVIEHRPVASIGSVEQRALHDARERLASLRVIGKLSPNLKSAGRWALNLIETTSGWHGRGCKLTMLPIDKFQRTMAALNNAIADAQTAADRERKPAPLFPPDPKAA